jgi:hypothetical protein
MKWFPSRRQGKSPKRWQGFILTPCCTCAEGIFLSYSHEQNCKIAVNLTRRDPPLGTVRLNKDDTCDLHPIIEPGEKLWEIHVCRTLGESYAAKKARYLKRLIERAKELKRVEAEKQSQQKPEETDHGNPSEAEDRGSDREGGSEEG